MESGKWRLLSTSLKNAGKLQVDSGASSGRGSSCSALARHRQGASLRRGLTSGLNGALCEDSLGELSLLRGSNPH